jgi:hypothetical protein
VLITVHDDSIRVRSATILLDSDLGTGMDRLSWLGAAGVR